MYASNYIFTNLRNESIVKDDTNFLADTDTKNCLYSLTILA